MSQVAIKALPFKFTSQQITAHLSTCHTPRHPLDAFPEYSFKAPYTVDSVKNLCSATNVPRNATREAAKKSHPRQPDTPRQKYPLFLAPTFSPITTKDLGLSPSLTKNLTNFYETPQSKSVDRQQMPLTRS